MRFSLQWYPSTGVFLLDFLPPFGGEGGAAITTMEADEESEDRTPVSEEEDASASCCCLGVALAIVLDVKLLL